MPINDYTEDNDYYTQGFESEGVVSIWVGLTNSKDTPDEIDVLQDLCGVGYYDLDSQESNYVDYKLNCYNLDCLKNNLKILHVTFCKT
jgi:hypothetical protein